MFSLSCISHVKRSSSDNSRPPAPPIATFTHIIVDRSGSMYSMNGVQNGMNIQLLKDTKDTAEKNQTPTYLTFTTFDNVVEKLVDNENILTSKLPSESDIAAVLAPRATTRFIDTVLETIEDINIQANAFLKTLPRATQILNPNIVKLINCTTDGEDNVSSHTESDLRNEMINFRMNGGQALLLAANMDAQVIGRKYGFREDTSLTVHASNPDAIKYAFTCLRSTSQRVTSGGTAIGYTQLQRSCSQEPSDTLDNTILTPPSALRRLPQYNTILPPTVVDDIDFNSFGMVMLPPPPPARPLRRSARQLARLNIKK